MRCPRMPITLALVGRLLAGKGQEVTYPLLVRLRNSHHRRAIPDKVRVLAPSVRESAAVAGQS